MAPTSVQEALRLWLDSVDPTRHEWAARELARARDAVASEGHWLDMDEWRHSTWFETRITTELVDGRSWFVVVVECDGQRLSCRCPSIERAWLFTQVYQHIIRSQFHSIGPPWADVPG